MSSAQFWTCEKADGALKCLKRCRSKCFEGLFSQLEHEFSNQDMYFVNVGLMYHAEATIGDMLCKFATIVATLALG